MDVFNRVLCKDVVKIEPRFLNKDFAKVVKERLKSKLEGVCSKHGYIKHESIDIQKIAPGTVELASLAGYVVFDVLFYADLCNPPLYSVVKGIVANVNKFGILAEAGYHHNGDYYSVLEVIIAKNSVNIQSEVDLDALKIGQEIRVELMGKKFELGERKMSAIGRVVKNVNEGKAPKAITKPSINDDDEVAADVEEGEDIYGDEDEEENEEEKSEVDQEEKSDIESVVEDEEEDEVAAAKGGSEFFSDDENFFSDEDFDGEADDGGEDGSEEEFSDEE